MLARRDVQRLGSVARCQRLDAPYMQQRRQRVDDVLYVVDDEHLAPGRRHRTRAREGRGRRERGDRARQLDHELAALAEARTVTGETPSVQLDEAPRER